MSVLTCSADLFQCCCLLGTGSHISVDEMKADKLRRALSLDKHGSQLALASDKNVFVYDVESGKTMRQVS